MDTDKISTLHDLDQWTKHRLSLWPPGSIILLSGDLGAGKTALVRSIISQKRAMVGLKNERVISPSFVIHQAYPEIKIDHFDLYRFDRATRSQLVEIGYFDALQNVRLAGGLCFVEWPEKCESLDLLEGDRIVSLVLNDDGSRSLSDRV